MEKFKFEVGPGNFEYYEKFIGADHQQLKFLFINLTDL